MSFWSKFGKILPFASMAIPFIGPTLGLGTAAATGAAAGGGSILSKVGTALGKAGEIGSALSPVLGAASANRAAGKVTDFNNDLTAAKFNNALPGQRLGTAARASLASAAPTKFNWGGPGSVARGESMPSFSGGFSSARDPRLAQIASSVMDKSLSDQMAGDGATDMVHAPVATGADKALTAGTTASGILGTIGTILAKRKATAAPGPGPYGTNPGDTI